MCTELRLYATLRYLGGGSVHDIRRALKTKKTSTYAIINQVCQAIIQCPALQVKFPQTQIECQEAARFSLHFSQRSDRQLCGSNRWLFVAH